MTSRTTSRAFRALAGALLIALATAVVGTTASAQTRTTRIIVPSTPGGGADILARLLAEQIGRMQGVTMVVENRPGAGNTIGTEAAARATPDGSTLLITTPEFVINPHLRKLSYDPISSFEPICYLVRSVQVIVVSAAAPYRTLGDLLAAARSKPGELTIASTGPASSPHIAIETLKRLANVDFIYVPYAGTGPAVNALLGQHLTVVFASFPNVSEQLGAGSLRAVAVASKTRTERLPEVATVAEQGFPEFEADIWFGVVAPSGTPKDTTSQLSTWFLDALKVPEITAKLAVQGLSPVGMCGAAFDAFTRREFDAYGGAIRAANIKAP
ncbi:MAG: tripartite tricarboxylate transporter substrate binding protein [Hyphomicrobiales bacterium]|nr:tripartite tricarboxylate transporter substrate binding protein [Hyphomicrobiales bacterium]